MIRILFVLMAFLTLHSLHATHNRAGEITYVQLDALTIKITITTYTKTSSADADRDSLEVFWGDGSFEFVDRSNDNGQELMNDVKVNKYEAIHTYPGRGTYTVYFTDPNRISNILNVNPPNSIDIKFYLSTTLTLLDPQFQGFNNSAILLQPPLDFACVGRKFIHNPNAFDIDGDSLSYDLVVPFQDFGSEVPNYIFPDQIAPGPNNNISLDPITGTFVWDAPQIQGEYNIAIRINEYREGVLINSIIRDMQILVRTCENLPPTIESEDEFCVVAGELVDIPITIDDPDEGQQVIAQATGGALLSTFRDPASFNAPNLYTDPALNTRLQWQTNCNHISDRFYQVVIRAVDNYFGDSTGLATLKTIRIKVVGPPPENLTAQSENGGINLAWDLPYSCENTEDDFFQGFSVWRKEISTTIVPDSCTPGLDGTGYEKIVFITTENDGNNYVHRDIDVEAQKVYCYRVLAEFANTTATGNPFNRVESLPSNEACEIVDRDIPFLTEANVISTDVASGIIRVSWVKPDPVDLDTIRNPGPYTYQVQRWTGSSFTDISGARFTSTTFAGTVDTTYLDTGLNTVDNDHTYRISFSSGTTLIGYSPEASSVFLEVMVGDRRNELSWNFNTPWNNTSFIVLRKLPGGLTFDSIATTQSNDYVDQDLNNGEEYCYIIQSIGSYGISELPEPLINNSQSVCGIPMDFDPPCIPIITVSNLCDDLKDNPEILDLGNTIIWDEDDCGTGEAAVEFNIYFQSRNGEDFSLIHTSSGNTLNEFFHELSGSIAGCYAITSLDSIGNESAFSDVICIENCPGYELPNTFTPNGDGSNDRFKPRINRFVDRIEITIFNQWGNQVFTTTDPEINWDGTNFSGSDLETGVYYYRCTVFEEDVTSGDIIEIDRLKGHINLIR